MTAPASSVNEPFNAVALSRRKSADPLVEVKRIWALLSASWIEVMVMREGGGGVSSRLTTRTLS